MGGRKSTVENDRMLKVVLTSGLGAHLAVICMDLQKLKDKAAHVLQVILDHAEQTAEVRCIDALLYKTSMGDWRTLTEDALAGLVVHTKLEPEVSRMVTLEVRVASTGEDEDEDKDDGDADDGSDGPAEVHERVLCDGCDMYPIIGRRYKSLCCNNFDVCQACFMNTHKHLAEWVRVRSNIFIFAEVGQLPYGLTFQDSRDAAACSSNTTVDSHSPAVPPRQEEMMLGNATRGQAGLTFPPGRAAAALQAVATRADDSICEAALNALLGHHDEAIRKAVAIELQDGDLEKLEQSSAASSLDLDEWTFAEQSYCMVEVEKGDYEDDDEAEPFIIASLEE